MKYLLLLLFCTLCSSHFCPAKHYWNRSLDKCLECKTCHVTLIPCTASMNTICATVQESNHHFLKGRLNYFDEDSDDEMHSKNHINHDESYLPFEELPKKSKHLKSKHNDRVSEKHHHKAKKHFEFKDDYDSEEDTNDDYDSYPVHDRFLKPKKHKKHYEFNKHEKKHDDFFYSDQYDDELYHPSKKSKKDNHKVTHLKKINSDEEKLEEWLLQSKKKLKLRKDDLLKTLKEESGEYGNVKKTIRLNSPIFESEFHEDKVIRNTMRGSDGADVNFLKESSKSDKDMKSLMADDKESYHPVKPSQRMYLGQPSVALGSGAEIKDPEETIRDEMGKNIIFDKPHFRVVPLVNSKEPHVGGDVVSLPFTAAETIVWDWQAVAVVSAVASCLVFFSVVAIYLVINARQGQGKKVGKHYNREIEEMSTRIALMHPALDRMNQDSANTLYMENITAVHGKDEDHKAHE